MIVMSTFVIMQVVEEASINCNSTIPDGMKCDRDRECGGSSLILDPDPSSAP
jgi:hypothetical protein